MLQNIRQVSSDKSDFTDATVECDGSVGNSGVGVFAQAVYIPNRESAT